MFPGFFLTGMLPVIPSFRIESRGYIKITIILAGREALQKGRTLAL